jgi:ABC-type nitrate/sulfonate/bicarbonate transport system permease component
MRRPAHLRKWMWAASPFVILLALWQALAYTRVLDPLFFPPPSVLATTVVEMIRDGSLARHLAATVRRLAAGFLIGSLSGLSCGLLMGGSARLRQMIEPLVSALYSTPKLTLLPMLMLFFGVGEASRVFLIAASCFVLLAMHALDAVRGVDPVHVQVARNYGARRLDVLRKVYLPASLPMIFTGLRVALGRGLVITISVELLTPSDGLGSMIWLAWQTFATERLYIGVILTAALGGVFHAVLRRLERRAIPWRNSDG